MSDDAEFAQGAAEWRPLTPAARAWFWLAVMLAVLTIATGAWLAAWPVDIDQGPR